VTASTLRSTGYFAFPWGTLGYAWLEVPVGAGRRRGRGAGAERADAASRRRWWPFPGCAARVGTDPAGPGARAALPPLLAGSGARRRRRGGRGRRRRAATRCPPSAPPCWCKATSTPSGAPFRPRRSSTTHIDLTRLRSAGWRPAARPGRVAGGGGDRHRRSKGARRRGGRAAIQAASPTSAFLVGGAPRRQAARATPPSRSPTPSPSGRYDKHVLVPFGERWPLSRPSPWLYRAAFGLLGLPMLVKHGARRGTGPLGAPAARMGSASATRAVFPTVWRRWRAPAPDVLVVITNDAWFAAATAPASTSTWVACARSRRAGGCCARATTASRRCRSVRPRGGGASTGIAATLPVRSGRTVVTPYARHADRVPWAGGGLVAAGDLPSLCGGHVKAAARVGQGMRRRCACAHLDGPPRRGYHAPPMNLVLVGGGEIGTQIAERRLPLAQRHRHRHRSRTRGRLHHHGRPVLPRQRHRPGRPARRRRREGRTPSWRAPPTTT
jgi:hypothetical protein